MMKITSITSKKIVACESGGVKSALSRNAHTLKILNRGPR
jgi:hypothetical protein